MRGRLQIFRSLLVDLALGSLERTALSSRRITSAAVLPPCYPTRNTLSTKMSLRPLAGTLVLVAVSMLVDGLSSSGEAATRSAREPSISGTAALPPSKIVLVRDSDLYLLTPGRSGLRRLTQTSEPESGPAASPDGRRIAFSRDGVIRDPSPQST
jgi:WD40-like Beta Propeller Repeat